MPTQTMTVGSVFSGIGGLDLGFERAGFRIRWMCEKDEYCRKILSKHWPYVPCYDDITELTEPLDADVIIGGFPCQDISLAGKGAGLDGSRSGLWWEMYRVISKVRPWYAVLENVPALTHRGLPAVLGALSEIGYDAEWEIVSAAALGAPHIRERIFIVAYSNRQRQQQPEGIPEQRRGRTRHCSKKAHGDDADANGCRRKTALQGVPSGQRHTIGGGAEDVADTSGERGKEPARQNGRPLGGGTEESGVDTDGAGEDVANAAGTGRRSAGSTGQEVHEPGEVERPTGLRGAPDGSYWATEPSVRPLANGIPNRVDRIRALGNAVVPQVAEYVARQVRRHAERNGLWR